MLAEWAPIGIGEVRLGSDEGPFVRGRVGSLGLAGVDLRTGRCRAQNEWLAIGDGELLGDVDRRLRRSPRCAGGERWYDDGEGTGHAWNLAGWSRQRCGYREEPTSGSEGVGRPAIVVTCA